MASRKPIVTNWCKPGVKRRYVITRALHWDIGKRGSGWTLNVPEGREFESSVPRWLWWFFSPDDPLFLKSAAIHDMLLEEGYRVQFADTQWIEAARSVHAPVIKRELAFAAIRLRRLFT